MDDLAAALAGSFEISNDPNKTSAPHPRFAMYKSKASSQDQDTRRKRLLEIQKKNRFDFVNHIRKLTEDDWKDDEDEDEEENDMDVEVRIKKPGRNFKGQLMLSEWLVEVPSDFEEEWLMLLCPVGRRTLVVTNGYSTKAYSKGGHFIQSFPSHLPGGNRRQKGRRGSTILDCLYNEVQKTYYVLDVMCWKDHPIYDTETEFRFYWMQQKLAEMQEVSEVSRINPIKFVPLPSFPCTSNSISEAVGDANFEIDGLLFYHKRAHYMFGSNPLVVWLKPYMLPEILGVSVPAQQMTHLPSSYTTYSNHMQEVGSNKAHDTQTTKRDYKAFWHQDRPRQHRTQSMDSESVDSQDVGAEGQGQRRALKTQDMEAEAVDSSELEAEGHDQGRSETKGLSDSALKETSAEAILSPRTEQVQGDMESEAQS